MIQYVAIDFETYLISAEQPIPKPVCLSYYDGENEKLWTTYEDMERALNILISSDYKIIAHNLKFELLVITEHFPHLKDKLKEKLANEGFICTMIYEKLVDNIREKSGFKYGLADLVSKYFNTDISDDKKDPDAWRLRYSELDGIPKADWPEKAIDYAIQDSVWAYKIYTERQKLEPIDCQVSIEAEYYLNWMGLQGILVDKSRVKTLESELIAKLTPKYKLLKEKNLVIQDKKGKYKKKVKDFREYISKLPGLVPEYTAKGILSTSGESLNRYLLQTKDETLQDYLDIIKYEKVLTAFVSRLKEADPLIRSEYNAVVSSGRTSSRTSSNFASVNIQQMPRSVEDVTWDIRNCFIPRLGFKIVSIDYSGLELASTAHRLNELTGQNDMLKILNSGDVPVDMHSMFAYRIKNMKEKTNITYEQFRDNKKHSGYKEYRQLAKPINLGFPGGIGYDTMRSLLAKEGIEPKLKVLEEAEFEDRLKWKAMQLRKEGYPVRIRRTEIRKYQLIYDELVELKQELFNLYPDLGNFLQEEHKQYLTGDSKYMKNDFGEWETEQMYAYSVYGFTRDWSTYTAFCNGCLMQSPSAIGAKKAMINIISKYMDSDYMKPLAFIHDEVVFEVSEDMDILTDCIKDVSEILISSMQEVLKDVRITVEAEAFDYWKKAGGFYEKTYWKNPQEDKLYELD